MAKPPHLRAFKVDANETIDILLHQVYYTFKMKFERARIDLERLSLYPLVSYIVVTFIHVAHAVSAVRSAHSAPSVGNDGSSTCEGVSAFSSPN